MRRPLSPPPIGHDREEPKSRSRTASRGYTVVEVLLALTVLTIGASAVMSMQKAAIQSNLDARQTDIANSIARMWVERIRKDAMGWTQPSPANAVANNFSTAALLNNHVLGVGTWTVPSDYLPAAAGYASISPGFDILGRDLPTASSLTAAPGPAFFCVHLQGAFLFQDATNAGNNLIRMDVRVVWPRGISGYAVGPCDPAVVAAVVPDPTLYHSIYMTTAVRQNSLQ